MKQENYDVFVSRYGTALNYEDQRLEELGQRLDELEEMAKSLESND